MSGCVHAWHVCVRHVLRQTRLEAYGVVWCGDVDVLTTPDESMSLRSSVFSILPPLPFCHPRAKSLAEKGQGSREQQAASVREEKGATLRRLWNNVYVYKLLPRTLPLSVSLSLSLSAALRVWGGLLESTPYALMYIIPSSSTSPASCSLPPPLAPACLSLPLIRLETHCSHATSLLALSSPYASHMSS